MCNEPISTSGRMFHMKVLTLVPQFDVRFDFVVEILNSE